MTAGEAAVEFWNPTDAASLLAAMEPQVPALLGDRFRGVLRPDVDEPGAPALVAVRDDGALVAILVQDAGGSADTDAAKWWLAAHRSLLARAYPGISPEAEPSAIALVPVGPIPGDGARRFVPVKVGGRCGVVLLPSV